MNSFESEHQEAVAKLVERVRAFYDKGHKVRIYHGGTNSTRHQEFDLTKALDTSDLNHIISIDSEKRYALVEPNVSMEQLARETLKFSLIPPVVMEFPNITVGGGVQGGAGEVAPSDRAFFIIVARNMKLFSEMEALCKHLRPKMLICTTEPHVPMERWESLH